MIKSGAYIQLLEFFSKPYNFSLLDDYSKWENITMTETFKRFDELRIVHKKYKLECDSWSLYPNKHLNGGLDKLNGIKNDLNEICRQFKIRVVFYEKKTQSFKQEVHASYYHEQRNVTDLIVFVKERKESSISY